jgi:hypothetical protein
MADRPGTDATPSGSTTPTDSEASADIDVDGKPNVASDRRDGRENTDPLLAWALASFHAAAFLVVPLALAHAIAPEAVGDLLGGLDTLVGIALYLVLWGSTWLSNRRYVAATDFADPWGTFRAGARYGAVTGLPLLVCVVLGVAVVVNPVFAGVLGVAGVVVAPLVGAVTGVVLAGVDLAVDRLASVLLP